MVPVHAAKVVPISLEQSQVTLSGPWWSQMVVCGTRWTPSRVAKVVPDGLVQSWVTVSGRCLQVVPDNPQVVLPK